MKYRSDLVILLDILEAIGENGSLISHIATYANMPYPRVKERLEIMIKNGLIEEKVDDEGRKLYVLTKEGLTLRDRIREIVYMLSEIGLLNTDKHK